MYIQIYDQKKGKNTVVCKYSLREQVSKSTVTSFFKYWPDTQDKATATPKANQINMTEQTGCFLIIHINRKTRSTCETSCKMIDCGSLAWTLGL